MSKFKVVTQAVEVNGVTYQPGEILEVQDNESAFTAIEAASLFATGHIVVATESDLKDEAQA